ncbi:hypothetical protein HDV00_012209 [Rhizophlyctis rosea]|nr:hypothetical protein HDV00_012209 [Rhizophlyctis rosea]
METIATFVTTEKDGGPSQMEDVREETVGLKTRSQSKDEEVQEEDRTAPDDVGSGDDQDAEGSLEEFPSKPSDMPSPDAELKEPTPEPAVSSIAKTRAKRSSAGSLPKSPPMKKRRGSIAVPKKEENGSDSEGGASAPSGEGKSGDAPPTPEATPQRHPRKAKQAAMASVVTKSPKTGTPTTTLTATSSPSSAKASSSSSSAAKPTTKTRTKRKTSPSTPETTKSKPDTKNPPSTTRSSSKSRSNFQWTQPAIDVLIAEAKAQHLSSGSNNWVAVSEAVGREMKPSTQQCKDKAKQLRKQGLIP